jgi:hypothetical protein
MVLLGVVAGSGKDATSPHADFRSGVALIAVDGQRARPYRVGALVDGRWRVRSFSRGTAVLQATDGAMADITLQVPHRGAAVGRP